VGGAGVVQLRGVNHPRIFAQPVSRRQVYHEEGRGGRSLKSCGLYYKCFTIYDRNDSGQYYKTTIMIVIHDPSFS